MSGQIAYGQWLAYGFRCPFCGYLFAKWVGTKEKELSLVMLFRCAKCGQVYEDIVS
jgi:rubredoxin